MKFLTLRLSFISKAAILLMLLCSILFSCQNDRGQIEHLTPIKPTIELGIVRFDQLIKDFSDKDVMEHFDSISEKYPAFCDLFTHEILEIQSDDQLRQELEIIREDTSYQNLYETVQSTFLNEVAFQSELAQAIENYGKVFNLSLEQLPTIYTFISGFTYQAFVFDDNGREGVGVGLDMFLSSDFPYTKILSKNPSFSEYLVRSYNKQHLAKKVIEVLVEDKMPPPNKSDFLHLMIWGGKKLYVLNEIMSFTPDSVVLEYTGDQLAWCMENESQMWNYFFQNDLFYQTDIRKFAKLIGPAPTSPGMPPESPGRTGNYMGWQVVKAFMRRNPDVSLVELVKMQDAQEILNLSKFKPR